MNISEIAKRAGVSSAAVSRYFNKGYISNEKREAIRKVVEETGYRPSMQARTLRTKKTKLIGVILPKIDSAAIGRVVRGILSELEEKGYQMLLADTRNDPEKELEYLTIFNTKQVDGVILLGTVFTAEHKQYLKDLDVPLVIVGQKLVGCSCVYHDDYHAAYDLTTLLLEKGRKNLGCLSVFHRDRAAGLARYQGFRDAVRTTGSMTMEQQYRIADFTMESGYQTAKELLEQYPSLDGILCATDSIAIGAMQYLKERKIRIPEEIALTGHGDTTMARVTAPTITTVHYAYEKSGQQAAKMLLEMLDGKEQAIREIKLGYSLVEQESTEGI